MGWSRGGILLGLLLLAGCYGGDEDDNLVDIGNAGVTPGGATAGGQTGGTVPGGSTGGTVPPGQTAPGDCREKWQPGEKYHPAGYADKAVHGLDAKLQVETCTNCHGDQLVGCLGAVSCDNCHDGGHPQGWRTNCTYCHGGTETMEGAPPTDLDRTTPASMISFTAHTKHQKGDTHPAFDCVQCHAKPVDVLSVGHMVDATKGVAEVDLSKGLSKDGKYGGAGSASCSNLYCHGDGVKPGDYAVSKGPTNCDSCHGTKDLARLSYDHGRHINSFRKFDAITCNSCHPNTDKENKIIDPSTHVNGKIEVKAEGITYDEAGKTCDGTCHTSYPHSKVKWEEKDPFGSIFGP